MHGKGTVKESAANRTGNAPPPERGSQVFEQVDRAQRLAERLHSVIQQLEGRIESILRQEPKCEEDANKQCSALVGLAADLESQNSSTEYAIQKVESLIKRCEL